VRVNAVAKVRLWKDEEAVEATTLDLSGGGFLAKVPKAGIWIGELYEAELTLPCGEKIDADVQAARRVAERLVSFAFIRIANGDRERVVREVFRLQRLAIARGLRA